MLVLQVIIIIYYSVIQYTWTKERFSKKKGSIFQLIVGFTNKFLTLFSRILPLTGKKYKNVN